MQDCELDLDQYEDNLLHRCWRVGANHSRTAAFSSFNKNEIAAVDIVACCKKITSLVEKTASELRRSSYSVTPKHQINYHFKDFAQLTCGVTNIYCRQVNVLLEDTKNLLDQIRGTTFDLVLTTKKSVIGTNRKRKSVITKESKLMISKRLRLDESDLLNKSVQQHYAKMLSESQVWQSESTQKSQSIELPRNYNQSSSYHTITITEEFEIHEDPSAIYPSDGFGDCDIPDLTFFQQLFPRNTAKRRLTIRASTDILPAKMPRMDVDIVELNTSQADSAILNTNYSVADSIDIDIESIVCEPSLPLDLYDPPSRKMSSVDNDIMTTHSVETSQHSTAKTTAKNSRRKKLIIDKCIKYSREKLMKEHSRYLDSLRENLVVITPPSERRKTPEDFLFKLNKQISIFPDIINYSITLTKEEKEVLSQITLRIIFGVEFTEDLVKKVFVPIMGRKMKEKNIVYQPDAQLEEDDFIITPPLLPVVESNNNNDISKHTISYTNNNIDAYSVMMDLLIIWRNNPEIHGIDANKFIQLFPDRITAALAFNFLLYLVRDSFIMISKKPNSIEMDKIELGPGSNKLIESLTLEIS